jgi:hypothetical protein
MIFSFINEVTFNIFIFFGILTNNFSIPNIMDVIFIIQYVFSIL